MQENRNFFHPSEENTLFNRGATSVKGSPIFLFEDKFEKGFSEALGKDRWLVGEGFQEVLLQTIEEVGYHLPF
jgi:hypothetical protein